MILWHKSLLKELSKDELQKLWKDCCYLSRNFSIDKNINPIMNKIKEYDSSEFIKYMNLIIMEMCNRGMYITLSNIREIYACFDSESVREAMNVFVDTMFWGWHTSQYLEDCKKLLNIKRRRIEYEFV